MSCPGSPRLSAFFQQLAEEDGDWDANSTLEQLWDAEPTGSLLLPSASFMDAPTDSEAALSDNGRHADSPSLSPGPSPGTAAAGAGTSTARTAEQLQPGSFNLLDALGRQLSTLSSMTLAGAQIWLHSPAAQLPAAELAAAGPQPFSADSLQRLVSSSSSDTQLAAAAAAALAPAAGLRPAVPPEPQHGGAAAPEFALGLVLQRPRLAAANSISRRPVPSVRHSLRLPTLLPLELVAQTDEGLSGPARVGSSVLRLPSLDPDVLPTDWGTPHTADAAAAPAPASPAAPGGVFTGVPDDGDEGLPSAMAAAAAAAVTEGPTRRPKKRRTKRRASVDSDDTAEQDTGRELEQLQEQVRLMSLRNTHLRLQLSELGAFKTLLQHKLAGLYEAAAEVEAANAHLRSSNACMAAVLGPYLPALQQQQAMLDAVLHHASGRAYY